MINKKIYFFMETINMEFKRYLYITLILLICLISISAVSAAEDTASDIISADDNEIILDEGIYDALSENDNDELILEQTDEGELDSADDETALKDEPTPGTFGDLYNDIMGNSDPVVTLTRDYKFRDGEDGYKEGIHITRGVTIDGKGHKIDANGKARIFYMYSWGIYIKNITFVNGKGTKGGAIFWSHSDYCNISDCTFINNTASTWGGGIAVIGGPDFYNRFVINCTFINNHALQGGAVLSEGWLRTTVINCIYKTESDTEYNAKIIAPTLTVDNLTTLYNSGEKLTFNLTTDEGIPITDGNITINVYKNDEFIGTYNCLSGDGWIVDLPVGIYNATCRSEYLGGNQVTATINIKFNAEITSSTETMELFVDDISKVEYTLSPKDVIGDVSFTSSNPKVVTVDSNGKITATGEGSATITISLTSEDYAAADATVNVKVNKIGAKLTAPAVTTTYNVAKNLVITLKNSQGKAISGVQVTVNMGSVKKYTTDKNGQVKIAIGNLVPKTYTAKVSFAENDKYKASSTTAKVVVKKATPKMTAKAKTFKFEDKTKKYTITLKDNKGKALKNKKVALKVKGKTYTAKTNSKGVATFKLSKLTKKDKFNAVISYAGDKCYKKVTKKAKITVKAPKKAKSTFTTVSKGSKDKAMVKKIQKALKNNGYYLSYKGRYLKVDGIYHSYTERAVKEFQNDKGLKVTGKVDEKTAKKLKLI